MLQSLAVFSSYFLPASQAFCMCVTSGSNLKRLPCRTDQTEMAGNRANAATRWGGPHTTWHTGITTNTAILPKKQRMVELMEQGLCQEQRLMKTHIPPYSSIAETWPNLPAFYQQAPSGLQAPEECGLPLPRKYVHSCSNTTTRTSHYMLRMSQEM